MIAAELDVVLPKLSFTSLYKFLKDTEHAHFSVEDFSKEESVYFERNHKNYPWERRILEYEGEIFYDYRNKKLFKNLISIIDSFPIIKDTRVVILLFQKKQEEYDFNYHFDKDEKYGFRICYNLNTNIPFLEFAKLKKEYSYVRNTLEKIQPFMVENNTYNLIPTKKNTVLMFDGVEYPHKVPVVNGNSKRLSIIVRGKLSDIKNLNFCQIIKK